MKCPRGQKTYKGYLALFVCFVTRAIHLEVVSELSTGAFIAALKRFTSQKGLCQEMFSDCGTNIVRAQKELKAFLQLVRSDDFNATVSTVLTEDEIVWHFNPPGAPHMGGLWEAGIKSVKHHLRRIIGVVTLNYEEFATILAQVEACLNSRPLMPCCSDPTDWSVFTPGHFFIDALVAVPEPDYSAIKSNLLKRWQLIQKMVQHFWKHWSGGTLTWFQQATEWMKSHENIKCGDLVLIREPNYPPTKWRMGRVKQVYPGKDTLVRVVDIWTTDGVLKRPISKIAKLPLDNGVTSNE